jgi:hypothetical protein
MTAEILDFPNSIDLQLERISQQDKRREQKREHEIGRLRIVLERTERNPLLRRHRANALGVDYRESPTGWTFAAL